MLPLAGTAPNQAIAVHPAAVLLLARNRHTVSSRSSKGCPKTPLDFGQRVTGHGEPQDVPHGEIDWTLGP